MKTICGLLTFLFAFSLNISAQSNFKSLTDVPKATIQSTTKTTSARKTPGLQISAEQDSILRANKALRSQIQAKAPKRTYNLNNRVKAQKVNAVGQPKPIKKHKTYQQAVSSNSAAGNTFVIPKDNPQARAEFEILRTRDPKTGSIPEGIRLKELNFMKSQQESILLPLGAGDQLIDWYNRGPFNVGGRTRALAVDIHDENIILAGGVSGGMWRSSDQGLTWSKATGSNELQSVSCIAQDPRDGHTSTWYYGTGEISGNSARGVGAPYRGDGIYKSIDNGLTWSILSSTSTDIPELFDQGFDYNYEIVVDPTNGNVLVSNFDGVYISTNGGDSFSLTLANTDDLGQWGDIVISSTGKAFALLDAYGVFSSIDGMNWTNITPESDYYLANGERSELALAPSNENIFYLIKEEFMRAGGHAMWRYNDADGSWTDLTESIPQLGGVTGDFTSQGGYDLLIKVKPDDENFVIIGGTNLFASTDGFQTSNNTSWIGGYTATNTSYGLYTNHHPDQHSFVFLDNNRAISGNDGGVQITDDITDVTTNGLQETVDWISLNNGYLTTQVYALSAGPGDQIMAGFQDNSTWLTVSTDGIVDWTDQFGGDGAYNAFNSDGTIRYMSSQNGNIYRETYIEGENDIVSEGSTYFTPDGYQAGLFIVPFYLDPVNDDLFYLAGNSQFYVNTQASTGSFLIGWKTIDLGITGVVSEIGVAGGNGVYLGTSDGEVFKVDDPGGQETVTNVSGSNFPSGYISGLGVNQLNPNELIITFSNYSIPSVFHTTDGGATWTDVSGNLEENPDGSGSGPSARTAQILGNSDRYFVGTSTGLYSTTSLNGASTVWVQEDSDGVGDVVVEHLVARPDGLILAGTHGNGIYSAVFETTGQPQNDLALTGISAPGNLVSGVESITVSVENLGIQTQLSFDLTYYVNDVEISTETVLESLAPRDKLDYTFNSTYDFSEENEYTIRVELSSGDDLASNNSISKLVVNAPFTGTYVLRQPEKTTLVASAVFANGYLFSPDGVNLIDIEYVDASKRGALMVYLSDFHSIPSFYEWTLDNGNVIFSNEQDSRLGCSSDPRIFLSTADSPGSYDSENDSEFTLTLKEDSANSCGPSQDVTFVVTKQSANDLSILSINSPDDDLTTAILPIEIGIMNLGSNAQSEFDVSYSINGVLISTETISTSLEPGEKLNYTFETEYNFSNAGVYEISAEVILSGDDNPANNVLTENREIIGLDGFTGPYILEQNPITSTGPSFIFGNGYLFDQSGVNEIFLEDIGNGMRQFSAIYLPDFHATLIDYRFSMIGDKTRFEDDQGTGLGCSGEILLSSADNQSSFDPFDDSEFFLQLKENPTDECSAGTGDVFFKFTKIPEFHDLALINIINPTPVFANGFSNVQVIVQNFGNVNEEIIDLTYFVNGEEAGSQVFQDVIRPNSSRFLTFDQPYDFSEPGFYEIRVEVNLPTDEFADNDSHVVTVQSLEPISEFPYLESFDNDGGALPEGWQFEEGVWNISDVSQSSETGPNTDNSGNGYYVYSEGFGSWIQSRHVDLSALNSPLLTFNYHMFNTPTSTFEVSVNGFSVFSANGSQQSSQTEAYKSASVNLANFSDQIVFISFAVSNLNEGNQEIVAIDDIGIMEALEHDLLVESIMSPVNLVSGEENISATIVNLGSRAQAEFELSYYVNDVLISTEIYSEIIRPGGRENFTFEAPFNFMEVGDYDIRVELDLPTDELPENNILEKQVSFSDAIPFVGFYQLEQVFPTNIGPSTTFGNGLLFFGSQFVIVDLVYIDATTRGVILNYLSEFGDQTREYLFTLDDRETYFNNNQETGLGCGNSILLSTADIPGEFEPLNDEEFTLWIKENPTDECAAGTVDVLFRFTKLINQTFDNDLEVTDVTNIQDVIPLSRQAIGFNVQNLGKFPQREFEATYYVDGEPVATEPFVIPNGLRSENSQSFLFFTPYEFDELRTYDIEVKLTRAADDNPLNDGAFLEITTSPFNINATPIANDRIGVEWVKLAEVNNVVLLRSLTGDFYDEISSLGDDDTFYIDDDINTSLLYFYRLRGQLSNGDVTFSPVTSAQATISGDYAYNKVLGDITGVDLSNNSYSASWADLDGDEDLDMIVSNVPNFNPNLSIRDVPSIYLNDGTGSFEKVVDNTVIDEGVSSRSTSLIDFNNDGSPDVFLSGFNSRIGDNTNRLFINDGVANFTKQNIPDFDINWSSEEGAWGDFDNDGDLDLFIAGRWLEGNINFLFENRGDGRLESITEGVIYESLYNSGLYSWAASWVDYDGDGDQDLYVPLDANLSGIPISAKLYRNDGTGNFEEITENEIIDESISVRGAQWADFDQDGSLDLLVNETDVAPIFYFNDGSGSFTKVTSSETLGIELNIHRISSIGDVNNNGKIDVIFASNGYFVYESNNDRTFTLLERILPEVENNGLFAGISLADMDGDGDLDLFRGNASSGYNYNFLYENLGNSNNWLHIELKGEFSNADGIGAKIELIADGITQYRTVTSSTGLIGQNSLIAEFGLGNIGFVDQVNVYWPSGTVKELFDIEVNQVIEINDSNAPTNVGLSNAGIPENLASGTPVGASFSIDVDSGDQHNYEIVTEGGGIAGGVNKYVSKNVYYRTDKFSSIASGAAAVSPDEIYQSNADSDNFFIENGTIKASTDFDFETQSSYSLRVRTTDSFGNSFEKIIQIDVLDVNEEIENNFPTDISLTNTRIDENVPANTRIGILLTTDLDDEGDHTFSLVDGDASGFVLDGNVLLTASPFDFETNESFSITIRTIDEGGLSFDKEYVISVDNVNEEPIELFLSNTALSENLVAGSLVGNLSTIDTDENDSHVYSISGEDAQNFQIIGNELLTSMPLNFEAQDSHVITIISTDAGGLEVSKEYQISITDQNEAPDALEISSTIIEENLPIGSVIASLSTIDEDANDEHSYSVSGPDADNFKILGNELRTNEEFNFEEIGLYEITLEVSDDGGLSYEIDVFIGVVDVNDVPSSLSLSNFTIPEEMNSGLTIGSLSTFDEDMFDSHTFSFVNGVGDEDNASFSIDGATLRSGEIFDFETKDSYSVRIQVSDGNGGSFEQIFAISIQDIDEDGPNTAPSSLNASGLVVAEDASIGVTIASFSTVDPDVGDAHTYSIVAGDASGFSIVNDELTLATSLNFEDISSYVITVRSTDSGGLIIDEEFTISVTDVNEAPTELIINGNLLFEGLEIGELVGLLTTFDQDADDSHTYGLSGPDASGFQIVGNQLQSAIQFNFEDKSEYEITITSTDEGGLSISTDIIVEIADVNEVPESISLDNASINEGVASGAVVGVFSTDDEDLNETHTYSLFGADASSFVIVIDELRTLDTFDFESKSSYDVSVITTDKRGLSLIKDFEILVLNVNEEPLSISLNGGSIPEREEIGTVVGLLGSLDVDENDTHTYEISGIDANSFEISGNEIRSTEIFNFELKSNYEIIITSTDAGGLSILEQFNITVTDVNEIPTDISLSSTTVDENVAIGTTVASIDFIDEDVGDSHTLTLSGADADQFTIVGEEFQSASIINFEEQAVYNFTLTITDALNQSGTENFTVNVNNLNEAPTSIELSNASITEGAAIGTIIGQLTVLDEDQGDTHTLVLSGADAASFKIVGSELQSNEVFSFNTQSSFDINIEASDGELSFLENFTITVASVTGIEDEDDHLITVYPNPSKGVFSIAIDKSFTNYNWKLYDLKGNTLRKSKSGQRLNDSFLNIDASSLLSGEYILELYNLERSITRTLVIIK